MKLLVAGCVGRGVDGGGGADNDGAGSGGGGEDGARVMLVEGLV